MKIIKKLDAFFQFVKLERITYNGEEILIVVEAGDKDR